MRLSASLIVKNEERFLEACLLSLRDLVDEVVVVDTGSADRTRDIARDLGARLHDFTWTDDFAAARNQALHLSRGEWIFYIDADERAAGATRADLEPFLADRFAIAHYVLLHPRPRFTAYWELRLFRNDPMVRFRGAIHETIWPAIHARRARTGGTIGRSPVALHHEGYEDNQHAKHLRNLPLLQRELEANPEKVFNWCHLARVQAALGNEAEAETAWRTALEVVRRKRRPPAADSLPYSDLIERGLARGHDVQDLVAEGRRRFPANVQIQWFHGKALMMDGRFEEALPVFADIVRAGAAQDFDRNIAYDIRLFDVFSYEALATCLFRLGRHGEAAAYFERAWRCDPSSLEFRAKRDLCLHLERSPARPRR